MLPLRMQHDQVLFLCNRHMTVSFIRLCLDRVQKVKDALSDVAIGTVETRLAVTTKLDWIDDKFALCTVQRLNSQISRPNATYSQVLINNILKALDL